MKNVQDIEIYAHSSIGIKERKKKKGHLIAVIRKPMIIIHDLILPVVGFILQLENLTHDVEKKKRVVAFNGRYLLQQHFVT